MKHISIIGKFLIIMAAFGLFTLGMALYSGQQIKNIDAAYSKLLEGESRAALYMARSNRALQAFRASVGDLLLSRSAESNAAIEKELKGAEAGFIKSMDTAIAALPGKQELPPIKADVLKVFRDVCGPTIVAGLAATSDEEVKASQQGAAPCQQAFIPLSPRFTELTTSIVDASDAQSSDLTDASNQTFLVTLGAVVLGLLAVLVLGFVAIRAWLVKPIQNMVTTMGTLANGDFTATVEGTDRRD